MICRIRAQGVGVGVGVGVGPNPNPNPIFYELLKSIKLYYHSFTQY